MAFLFHNTDQVLLLQRLNSFSYDGYDINYYYFQIRYEVECFVRSKMPNIPAHSLVMLYKFTLDHLSSIAHSPVNRHFLDWDAQNFNPLLMNNSQSYAPVSNIALITTVSNNNHNYFSNNSGGNPGSDVPPPATISLPTANTNDNISLAFGDHHPGDRLQNDQVPNTPITDASRSRCTNGTRLGSVAHSNRPDLPLGATSRSIQSTKTPAMQQTDSEGGECPVEMTQSKVKSAFSDSSPIRVTESPPLQHIQFEDWKNPSLRNTKRTGNRYDLITGFPPPPEFSSGPHVSAHLSQLFPCDYGEWKRTRMDAKNIIWSCSCPVPAILRLTIAVDSVDIPFVDYYVPSGQGIPHDEVTSYPLGDTMTPWEIEELKSIVHQSPNMQPNLAYKLWIEKCTNYKDPLSRCPSAIPGIRCQVKTRRTLYSTSVIFNQFLGFFRYYRQYLRASKRDLSSPPTSIAYLWSFQTKHSFWDHLRFITDSFQFKPMPLDFFTSIDQLASYLHIGPTSIFTIPVECSDLDDLDLSPDQKTKALGSLFCFGLAHLWTLCLFLKQKVEMRALLSDFTRLTKIGCHLNVVGPCSHQINRRSKSRITRRKHSLGNQFSTGETATAVLLYHIALQKITPRVFEAEVFVVACDASDQSRAIFKGTSAAHPTILQIPDKIHVTRHPQEDPTWRSKMKEKKNSPVGYTTK
jgi:hypothetical protein